MGLSIAMSAAQALAQQKQQEDAAKAQSDTIRQNADINNLQLQQQFQQTNQQSQQEQSKYAIQAMQEMGHIDAVAAESGMTGTTDTRLRNEAANVADQNVATIEANRIKAQDQAHASGMASQAQARVQMASIKQPSDLSTGLQIAGSTLNTYTNYQKTQPPAAK